MHAFAQQAKLISQEFHDLRCQWMVRWCLCLVASFVVRAARSADASFRSLHTRCWQDGVRILELEGRIAISPATGESVVRRSCPESEVRCFGSSNEPQWEGFSPQYHRALCETSLAGVVFRP